MGFPMMLSFDSFSKQYLVTLKGSISHTVALGTDAHGNIIRINNVLGAIPERLEQCREQLKTIRQQMETAKEQVEVPFEKEQELQEKSKRLAELNVLLNMDKSQPEILDMEPEQEEEPMQCGRAR